MLHYEIVVADICNFSLFPDEEEVLINIGTAFKVDAITFNSSQDIWHIKLVVTNDCFMLVQAHIDNVKRILKESNPTRLFGYALIDMGQYEKAHMYYKQHLDTLSEDDEEYPSLCIGLGYLHYLQNDYEQAIQYDKQAYDLRKMNLQSSHIDIAQSAIALGSDYKEKGNYDLAMELFKEGLEIREKNYVGIDHPDIGMAMICIGDTYTHLNDYQNAYEYLLKGLKMYERVLPAEHPRLARALIKMGILFEKQKIYDCALDYYERGYKMAERVLPIEHPRLLHYLEHILTIFKKVNNRDSALHICNEKLTILRKTLGEDHQIIAQIHMFVSDYCTDDKEQQLHGYQQALAILEKRKSINVKLINDCQEKIVAIINSRD